MAQATKDGIHENFENTENSDYYESDFFERPQNNVKDTCVFCKSRNHLSSQCKFYSTPFDYHSCLFKQFRCFNCFEKGHKGIDCPQNKLCTFCQDPRPHSAILCNKNKSYYY